MNITGYKAKHEHPDPQCKPKCEIMTLVMALDVKDKDYPAEWTYDAQGKPTCTAFVKWDWGNDNDGWNEPPPIEPDDPNQLVMPFELEAMEYVKPQPKPATV